LALPPATDPGESFIREVDEEYRRDQLARFWTRYGRWLLIALGLFLVAFAGYLYWREEQNRAAGDFGAKVLQAADQLEAGNTQDAAPVFAEATTSSREGYEAIGRLAQAALAASQGKTADAANMYAAVAAADDLAQPFRDLATIRQTMLQFDTLPPATVIARLQPLAKAGSPWFGTAGEMLAVAHMRSGKPELAGPLFAAIAKDTTVPASIRARTGQMASMLGVSALPTTAPAGDAPAPSAKAE
jgi:hypothetical protein